MSLPPVSSSISVPFKIRPEIPPDVAFIAEIVRDAFRDDPRSSHTEHFIVDALRKAKGLSVSLVAAINGQVVGHIAFSPVEICDGSQGWYGLGPIAVKLEFQGQGIGQALVRKGLAALRELGAQGCVVLGEPEYYERFGFQHCQDLVLEGVPQEYFLSLAFSEKLAFGHVKYHEAFQEKK